MTKEIPTNKDLFNKQMLMIVNFYFNLTSYEIDIMTHILNSGKTIIDTNLRHELKGNLKKDSFNINNYISRLKKKGILEKDSTGGQLKVNPQFLALFTDKEITFKFVDQNVTTSDKKSRNLSEA